MSSTTITHLPILKCSNLFLLYTQKITVSSYLFIVAHYVLSNYYYKTYKLRMQMSGDIT